MFPSHSKTLVPSHAIWEGTPIHAIVNDKSLTFDPNWTRNIKYVMLDQTCLHICQLVLSFDDTATMSFVPNYFKCQKEADTPWPRMLRLLKSGKSLLTAPVIYYISLVRETAALVLIRSGRVPIPCKGPIPALFQSIRKAKKSLMSSTALRQKMLVK